MLQIKKILVVLLSVLCFCFMADAQSDRNYIRQGNVRAVIAQDGTLEEINNYYPYGSLMGESSPGVQTFKYGAKELDRQNGINLYDSQARFYDPIICRTTTQDPLAEKYYSTSPYLWCAGNPMKYVDRDGKKVELYATSLPGCNIPLATHTFIVVRDEKNVVKGYYAFGSELDGFSGAFSGRLKRVKYSQDKNVYNNIDKKHLKKVITIKPPKGMNSNEFDDKIISIAESFGNNTGVRYFLAPNATNLTEGNCNTSTSTILLKAGISQEQISEIKKEIPGLSWGFSIYARPWTEEEQGQSVAIQKQIDLIYDIITNQ